jgi:hypothetical protein
MFYKIFTHDSASGPTKKNGPKNVFLGFYWEKCKRHTDIL